LPVCLVLIALYFDHLDIKKEKRKSPKNIEEKKRLKPFIKKKLIINFFIHLNFAFLKRLDAILRFKRILLRFL